MNINSDRIALFKQALGNYPTGVTVITAIDENGDPIGLTVNSFASVSIDPLLILWSIGKHASTYHTFKNIDQFAVNILAADQKEIAMLFATKDEERFSNCDWTFSENGLPIISDSVATLECKTFKNIEIGDHTTLFGEVIGMRAVDKTPLLYHKREIAPLPAEFHK